MGPGLMGGAVRPPRTSTQGRIGNPFGSVVVQLKDDRGSRAPPNLGGPSWPLPRRRRLNLTLQTEAILQQGLECRSRATPRRASAPTAAHSGRRLQLDDWQVSLVLDMADYQHEIHAALAADRCRWSGARTEGTGQIECRKSIGGLLKFYRRAA